MDLTASLGLSTAVSSSRIPFLKALIPCATSPIRSEILPRPNSSRTTAITTIQCQMLSEPILQPSNTNGRSPSLISSERRLGRRQKQALRRRQIVSDVTVMWLPLTGAEAPLQPTKGLAFALVAAAFGLDVRRQRQFQVAGLERILVLAKRRIVRRSRYGETGRQARVQQACALQLIEARKVAEHFQAELRQERLGGPKRQRPARRLPPSARPDPAGLEQDIERALGGDDTPDLLYLGARHRLVIGDDRQHLDRRAREAPCLRAFARHQPGEIAGGAERPFVADAYQIDATRCIFRLQLRERRLHIDPIGHALGKGGRIQRFARRKQQGFEKAQLFGPRLGASG